MGSFPTLLEVERFAGLVNSGSSTWTTITAGTANTKGSYTQLVASTSFVSLGFVVGVRSATANLSFLIDIAVGAAASEQVILPNLWYRTPSGTTVGQLSAYLPIAIRDGVRVAARCQCGTASSTCFVGLYLCGVM